MKQLMKLLDAVILITLALDFIDEDDGQTNLNARSVALEWIFSTKNRIGLSSSPQQSVLPVRSLTSNYSCWSREAGLLPVSVDECQTLNFC